jgi:uncharacterized protein involved in exopolysaccharide biosynthesis
MTEQVFETAEDASRAQREDESVINGEPREIGILEVLTELARRKSLFAKVIGASSAIGIILCLVLPAHYTATTKIMSPQEGQSTTSMMMSQIMGSGSDPLAAIAGGGLTPKSPNDLYIGLLGSRLVADAIIERFGLVEVYRVKDMTAARNALALNTLISSEKSGFIDISVTDKDKKRAADIANAYPELLRGLSKSLAVTDASRRRLFYEDQLRQAKDSLIQAELGFQHVQQEKGIVQLDAQAKAIIESLAEIRARIAAKEVEVEALKSYSTDRNPNVELALNELSSLRSQADQMATRNNANGFADLGLKQVSGAGLEYLQADHELRYRQAVYDMLLKQLDTARLDEAKDAAIIQIVEPAIMPERRSSPKRTLVMLVWVFIGIAASFALVLVQMGQRMVSCNPRLQSRLENFRAAMYR